MGGFLARHFLRLRKLVKKGTVIQYLLSDAGQITYGQLFKKHLTPGKALYFSHGFGITYKETYKYHPT